MLNEINTPPLKALDLYIGCDGWLTLDLMEDPEASRSFNTYAIEPLTLIREYINQHWDHEENRIPNRESGCVIDLIESLKRCVSDLEKAVYEDKNPAPDTTD